MKKEDKNEEPLIRQVILQGLNAGVTVLSAHENDTLDILCGKALSLLERISKQDGK